MANRTTPPGLYLLFGSVVALAIGPFLPWLQATAPFAGTISRSGMDNGGDGLYVAGCAVALGIVAIFALQERSKRTTAIVAIVLGVIVAAIVGYDAHDISARFADAKATSPLISTSYGSGLYLSALGAALAFIGGCMLLSSNTAGATDASTPDVAADEAPPLHGMVCANGHDNPPSARYCNTCGTKAVAPF